MSRLPTFPFDPQRAIGTVIEAGAAYVKANLPDAASPEGAWLHGHRLGRGEVGEFAIIQSANYGILGRITFVRLPERERLTVEPSIGRWTPESHPVGTIQMLSTIELESGKVITGVACYPRLGAQVYSVSPSLLQWIVEASQVSLNEEEPLLIHLGRLARSTATSIRLTPERLFGRHCAILGATGGGKSWTIARLVEQLVALRSKVVLIDATGEFYDLATGVTHVYIGSQPDNPPGASEVVFPHQELEEGDLFALFRPSGQAQAPKLREAIRSLKLAHQVGLQVGTPQGARRAQSLQLANGNLTKAGLSKVLFEEACRTFQAHINNPYAVFDISRLPRQIELECVYPSAQGNDATRWGTMNPQEFGYCVSLISRISSSLASPEFSCIFQPGGRQPVSKCISDFLAEPEARVLRISLKHLPFTNYLREIVANAVGRLLLAWARNGQFYDHPLVVFVDEAHQFLSKLIGDDYFQHSLNAFELIAKEGRKYWLTITLSTQRPRDIPEGVLSQVGTMIVHRLTNDRDREVVERAAGDIDRTATTFLPTLGQGEAAVIGVDFQFPLPVQVLTPSRPPKSTGPDYQKAWRHAVGATQQADAPVGQDQGEASGANQES